MKRPLFLVLLTLCGAGWAEPQSIQQAVDRLESNDLKIVALIDKVVKNFNSVTCAHTFKESNYYLISPATPTDKETRLEAVEVCSKCGALRVKQ